MWKKLDELNKGFKNIKEKERAEEKKNVYHDHSLTIFL